MADTEDVLVGELNNPSGRIAFEDPMYMQEKTKCVVQLTPGIADITIRRNEGLNVAITVATHRTPNPTGWSPVGTVAIDSARIVVADDDELDELWTDDGPDRIGYVNDDDLCRVLRHEFGLKTVAADHWPMRVTTPVSLELEEQIWEFLKTDSRFKDHPLWATFKVRTNSSTDRALDVTEPWEWHPIDQRSTPRMLICDTGYGDGTYTVEVGTADGSPVAARIVFLDDDDVQRIVVKDQKEPLIRRIVRLFTGR